MSGVTEPLSYKDKMVRIILTVTEFRYLDFRISRASHKTFIFFLMVLPLFLMFSLLFVH